MATLMLVFLFIMVLIVVVYTVLAEWIYISASWLILSLLFSIAVRSFGFCSTLEAEPNSLKTSISSLRVATMIITCICILAIDFTTFPRRYANTGTFGIGWMDLGVGSFVIANLLVSWQA